MHHALRKGPLFTKKHPLHVPLFYIKNFFYFYNLPFSTFFFTKHLPFSTFYKKHAPPHFISCLRAWSSMHSMLFKLAPGLTTIWSVSRSYNILLVACGNSSQSHIAYTYRTSHIFLQKSQLSHAPIHLTLSISVILKILSWQKLHPKHNTISLQPFEKK